MKDFLAFGVVAIGDGIAIVADGDDAKLEERTMARTPRMAQIEALLVDDPDDAFLRYGLAMEHASAGDDAVCVNVLNDLITRPASQPYVPAFLQCGQALMRLDRTEEACAVLKQGVEVAGRAGDTHAQGEMQGLLASLE